jgi:small conductance mechanosensitive channel
MINFLEDAASTTTETTSGFSWESIWESIKSWCLTTGVKLIIGIILLVIVFIIINQFAKGLRKSLRKKGKDELVCNAVYNITRKVLKILALIVFFGFIGIEMTGIASIISSCAVALGLALQGSLSNIAGWVILIVTRPFRLGDFIEAQGVSGTVEEINLIYTHLKTTDNKVIYLPNGALSGGNIINYSVKPIRRLEQLYTIAYSSDVDLALKVIKETASKHSLVLKDPEPFVKVNSYDDSAITITLRVWMKNEDYWTVNYDLLDQVKKTLDENKIEIPFNQLDVTIKNK